jgi:protein gp37
MGKASFYGEDLHLNLLRGCVDDGACPLWDSCWARGLARRLAGRYGYPADAPFAPHTAPGLAWLRARDALNAARRSTVVAANFMGDIAVQPSAEVQNFAAWCSEFNRATFLWLTKRPALLREKLGDVRLSENVWPGASAWDQPSLDRNVAALQRIPAARRWLSLEPLWAPVDIRYNGDSAPMDLDWICVGCESGPKRRIHSTYLVRPLRVDELVRVDLDRNEAAFLSAVRSLRDQCRAAGTPLYVKQLPLGGKVVRDVAEFPEDLRIQERLWRTHS